jgi:signal transduction histidine kinase
MSTHVSNERHQTGRPTTPEACYDGLIADDSRPSVNILLVDDQPAKLLTYETILEDLRENLIRASSAREALQRLLDTDIAVVLVDVCMPEMDGFELAKLIREHPRYAKTAIILVSAVYMSDIDRIKGFLSGAVDYVPVPIVPEVLRAKVSIFADLYRKTEQLRRLNSELEQRVTERTSELESSTARLLESEERRNQLLESERAARASAEQANRLKDDFLANLSHELRTPISAVVGWTQIMRRSKLDTQTMHEGLDAIERGVRSQVQLIDDLLDVSRITSGKLRLETEVVNVAAILIAAVDMILPLANAKNIPITKSLDCHEALLSGDGTRLQQVFWNLLTNAVKFTPQGGQIKVRLDRVGPCVRISICDSGHGIDPDFLPHIFERFRQADSSSTRKYGGLGLGLAIVKHLVELHSGTIRADSDGPGRGAKFTIDLPLTSHTRADHPTRPASSSPKKIDFTGLRLLVVDDDPETRAIVHRLLTESNAEIALAVSADDGLQKYDDFVPDIVISDISMPEKDGYEFVRELRQHPLGKKVPVVALTAFARPEDRLRSRQAGYDKHLSKPVDPQELLTLIGELAERRIEGPAP